MRSLYATVIEAGLYIGAFGCAVGFTLIIGHHLLAEGWDGRLATTWALAMTLAAIFVTGPLLVTGKIKRERGCMALPMLLLAALVEVGALLLLDKG